jgi:probable H4MPT-linked C1 transfer pathway protein
MTGELADCYATKEAGVRHIVESVQQVADGRTVAVYLVTGELVAPEAALDCPALAAASNWHALASFACRYVGRPSRRTANDAGFGVLLDIGSTTSDLVPISEKGPRTRFRTDLDRLVARELVYTGVRRTPVCGLVRELPWREGTCPVAQELFATTADAYVLLGDLPDDARDMVTADGRPLTQEDALARMARMFCLDRDSFSRSDAIRAAAAVRDAQVQLLDAALSQVLAAMPAPPGMVVLSGEGEFLARRLLSMRIVNAEWISLQDVLGANVSRAAPAHALAVRAREQWEEGV